MYHVRKESLAFVMLKYDEKMLILKVIYWLQFCFHLALCEFDGEESALDPANHFLYRSNAKGEKYLQALFMLSPL